MNWKFVHRVWALVWWPRKLKLGAQTLCMALLLFAGTANPARADCPAAPIADPDDMAISFLAANGVQAASASLLASTVKEGTLVYDDTADKLKVCDGTNWIDVGSGSGTDTLASLSCTTGQIAKFDGTAWACAADGGGSGGAPLSFYANRSGAGIQTVTSGVATKVIFTNDSTGLASDPDNTFDTTLSRFTPNEAGKYLVIGSVNCLGNTGFCINYIYKNGGVIANTYANSTANQTYPVVTIVDMNGTTDYLEVWTLNNGGTQLDGSIQNTYFTASLLGGGGDTLTGLSCATNEIPKWNGSAWTCATDGGGGGGATHAFRAYFSGKSFSAGYNTITGYTEEFDTGNNFDPATGVFTAPESGEYMIAGLIHASVATGSSVFAQFVAPGASWTYGGRFYTNGEAPMSPFSSVVKLSAGQTVYIQSYSSTASTSVAGFFSGFKIGGGSDTLSGLSCSTNEIPKWNGTTWACAADGGGGSGNTVAFSVHKNGTNQTVTTASWVPLSWSTEAFDTNNNFDTGTGRFTPTVAGKYLVTAQVQCSGATTLCAAAVYKNGSVASENVIPAVGSQEAQAVVLLEMNGSTDYVEAYAHNGGGTVIIGTAANTNFQGFLIGGSGTDTLSGLSCSTNEIPKWNGTAWACAADGGADTLAGLSCAAGEVPEWNGSAWICGTGSGGGVTGLLQASGTVTATCGGTWNTTPFIMGTETVDEASIHNTGNGRVTPTAGRWLVIAKTTPNSAALNAHLFLHMRKNGTGSWYGIVDSPMGRNSSANTIYTSGITAVGVLDANGTDYYEFGLEYGNCSAGDTITHNPSVTMIPLAAGGSGTDTLSGLSCAAGEVPEWDGSDWICGTGSGGSGSAGIWSAVSTGMLYGNTVTPTMTDIPGMSVTFNLPTATTVLLLAEGSIRRESAVTSQSGFGFVIDGVLQGNASWGEAIQSIFATGYEHSTWVISRVASLGAGSHTIKVRAGPIGDLRVCSENGGGIVDYKKCRLTVIAVGSGNGGSGSDTLAGLSCAAGEVPEWDGSDWICGTGSGGGAAADFGAYQTITQFGTDIVAPSAGMVLHSADQAGSFCHVQIFVNGVNVATDKGYNTSSIAQSVTAPVAAGDTYRLSNDADCTNVKAFFVPLTGGGGSAEAAGDGGQIQFNDGADALAADAALHWDNTNKRLGIGTTTPESSLVTVDTGTATPRGIVASQYNTGVQAPLFIGRKARGTPGTPAGIETGDYLVALQGQGHNSTSLANPQTILGLIAAETWTPASNATRLSFWTTPVSGIVAQERMRIDQTGAVSIGTATDANTSSLLELTSTTKGFLPPRMTTAQRDAIASPAEGLVVYNTTTKSLNLRVASSWLSFGGSMSGNTMVSGWPDALQCTIPGVISPGKATFNMVQSGRTDSVYHTLYRLAINSNYYWINFNSDGTYQGNSGNFGASDCLNKSVSQLYSSGLAFNFVGGATASADGIAGQVQFNEGGNLKADAALHWDNTNKRLGIGTMSPGLPLEVVGGAQVTNGGFTISNDDNWNSIITNHFSAAKHSVFRGVRGRGTAASPAAAQANDILTMFDAYGYTNPTTTAKAGGISVIAETNFNSAVDGALLFNTTSAGTNTERMRLTSGGHLVLASNAPVWSSPAGRRFISVKGVGEAGGIEMAQGSTDADGATVGIVQFSSENNTNATNGPRSAALVARQMGATANDRGGRLEFLTKADGGPLVERMRIDNVGNVGIGTTAPGAKLHVVGIAEITGAVPFNTNHEYLRFRGSDYGANKPYMFMKTDGSSGWSIGLWDGDDHGSTLLSFYAGNYNFAGGNVGIGTTTPVSTLQVGAQIPGYLPAVMIRTDSAEQTALRVQSGGGAASAFVAHKYSDNSVLFDIKDSGNVGIGTTTPDARLKIWSVSADNVPGFAVDGGGDAADEHVAYLLGRDSTFPATVLRLASNAASGSSYKFIEAVSDEDGSPITQFVVSGDGYVGIGLAAPGYRLDLPNTSGLA